MGRKCLCNALMATAGYPQIRAGKLDEAGIVTSGDALVDVAQFLKPGADGYTAADVVRALIGPNFPRRGAPTGRLPCGSLTFTAGLSRPASRGYVCRP